MPKELEEAALVDGAGPVGTFFRIMLPGATPALLIVFLFSFVWQYNDVFLTSMFMTRSATLLPFTMERLPILLTSSYHSYEYSIEYASLVMNRAMLMFLALVLLVFALLQRHFVESVERTGLVG